MTRHLPLLLLLALVPACNTVEGIGRDVQSGGEAIEQGAEKTKKAISN